VPAAGPSATVDALFFTPEGRANPYPHYHALREAAPIWKSAKLGAWLLTRYDDCQAVLRDPRLGKDYPRQMEFRFGPDWRRHPSLARGEHSMVNVDGPEHMRLRRLVVKAFSRRTVEALRPSIERTALELLAPLAEAGRGELLETLAFPLPVLVIGELLGVPAADRHQFRSIVSDQVAVVEARPSAEQLMRADAATIVSREYFLRLVAEKRKRPADDLISRLAHTEDNGDRLTDDELVTLSSLLFAAGFETTTNLVGNGLLGLLRHPSELEQLRAEPALFANLSDELLRYDGTAQLANRAAKVAVEIAGVTIQPGDAVLTLLGAANHDPARFPDPDRLDVGRTGTEPLTFGGGIHFCLGALLAYAEIDIVFRTLVSRFPVIQLVREPRFRDRLTLRGLESLEIAVRTEAPARPAWQLEAPSRPAAVAAIPVAAAPIDPGAAVLGLRPARDDGAWRAALRGRVERGETIERDLAAKMVLLGRTTVFRHCTFAELEELAATAYPMSFAPGDHLCTEGADAPECYVIAEGEATVSIGGRAVRTVHEDEVVGERGPIEGRPRSATVAATTHMTTWAISRDRLLAIVSRNAGLGSRLREEMARRYES
jgi:cytochrome P450